MEGQRLVGRKILKPLGDTGTVVHGHVKDYNPPVNGREETWTVQFENLQGSDNGDGDGGGSGSDGGSVREEAVRRPELDKWLNLQSVKEREFPVCDGVFLVVAEKTAAIALAGSVISVFSLAAVFFLR